MISVFALVILLVCTLPGGVAAQMGQPVEGGLRITFEDLRLPGDEWMGLVGLTRHFSVRQGAYVGLAAYGAVTGRRGGFFTGGFEAGWQHRWAHWKGGMGLFMGGGGGGSAPQGGGLMIRPQLGVARAGPGGWWGIQGSWIYYPNGAIDSRQLAFSWERDWSMWMRSGWDTEPGVRGGAREHWFGVQSTHYFPDRDRDGIGDPLAGTMDLLGVRWRPHLKGPWYGDFETAGAWGGGVDGFAQVLAGLQGWWPVIGPVQVGAGLLGGAAGGGRVHTGGGMIARLWSGVLIEAPRDWGWILEGGYNTARDGGFRGMGVALSLSRRWHTFDPDRRGRQALRWYRWRVRPALQRYVGMGPSDRKFSSLDGVPVDLVGIKLDTVSKEGGGYLTGQAWGAFDGGAGGYAVGLLGAGWVRPGGAWRPWLELGVGAAGGGGIAVGPGILAQPMLGISRRLGDDGALSLAIGHVWAVQGSFRSPVLEWSYVLRFTTPGAS